MDVKFIVLLTLLIPSFGFSQMKQSIDYIRGIEYSYRHLETSSEDVFINGILEGRNKKETGKINWRKGLNYNLKLTNNLFFKTGVRLASIGYKGEKQTDLMWPSQHNGNGGFDPNIQGEFQEHQFIYDYWFIEMPLALRLEVNRKKLSPFVEFGISPSRYMTTRIRSITEKGTKIIFQNHYIHNFNEIHKVGYISSGLNYSLNEKLQIFGQSIFRYHFTNLADAPIAEYLYNYGVEIGIRRRIK